MFVLDGSRLYDAHSVTYPPGRDTERRAEARRQPGKAVLTKKQAVGKIQSAILPLDPAFFALPELFAQLALENLPGAALGQRFGEKLELVRKLEFRQPLRCESE